MSVCRAVCLRAGGGLWLVQLLVDKAPPQSLTEHRMGGSVITAAPGASVCTLCAPRSGQRALPADRAVARPTVFLGWS